MPPPGELPLDVTARRSLGGDESISKACFTAKMGGKFRNADRLHRRQSRIKLERYQALHLCKRTLFHHLVQPSLGARVKFIARHLYEDALCGNPRQGRNQLRLLMPFLERAPGRLQDLERPHDPLPVTWFQAPSLGLIQLLQNAV